MKATWRDDINRRHQCIKEAGLWRARSTLSSAQSSEVLLSGAQVLNFSSNDYLGLANNPVVKEAAKQAVHRWGVGSGASHLVCGHASPHHELEQAIAKFVGAERALLFSNGYMANLAISSAFLNKGDLLLQDKLNHASLIDAGLLSRALLRRYAHCDLSHVKRMLSNVEFNKLMLATDAVFSMDGDVAPLAGLALLTEKNNGLLLVDDAHGFGVLGDCGRGSLNSVGLKPGGNVLMMGTLGKAFGSFGAFIAGDGVYIDHLIQAARSYIYTTALPPSIAAASLTSLSYVQEQGGALQKSLSQNIAYFKAQSAATGLVLMPSNTPIQPILLGDSARAQKVSAKLLDRGVLLRAIRPPTVPEGTARLRVALSSSHSFSQIDRLVNVLSEVVDGQC